MSCHWCVGPYLYPGLRGTPFQPLPSQWPSPNLVVEACCEVFDTMGRTLQTYRESLVNLGPKIVADDLMGTGARPCRMTSDIRAMVVYILIRSCMWLPSPGDTPQPYTYAMIGRYFNTTKPSIHRAHHRALDLLDTDPKYGELYQLVRALLGSRGFNIHRSER